MGFVDPIGNFILPLESHHVNLYKEENVSLFSRMGYSDKIKEQKEAITKSLQMIHEICYLELMKVKMRASEYDVKAGTVGTWLHVDMIDTGDTMTTQLSQLEEYSQYADAVSSNYSIFNHPCPEYFS